ncbi:MAG: hypothetical protein WCS51_04940, partial [Bacilli bacterium]
MEIPQLISLGLNLLFALAILLGFLWGIKRGLKKSTYRILCIGVCLLLAFLLAAPTTSLLLNLDISSIIQLEMSNGQIAQTLKEYVENFISSNAEIADLIASSDALEQLIFQLPGLVVNVFIFVIYFWLFKIISWPIFAGIAKNAYKKLNDSDPEPKKYRLWGGLVGAFQGLIIICITFVPITGVVSLVNELNQTTTSVSATSENDDISNQTLLEYALGESLDPEMYTYFESVNDSAIIKTNSIIQFNSIFFDTLASAKAGNDTIVIRHELKLLNEAFNEGKQLLELDLNFDDFASIEELFDHLDTFENLATILFKSSTLSIATNEVLPYFANKMLIENGDQMNSMVYSFLRGYLDTYGTPQFNTFKSDVFAIIDVAKVFRDENLLGIFNESEITVDIANDYFQDNGTNQPINDIMDAVLSSQTLRNLLAQGVNLALDAIGEYLSDYTGTSVVLQDTEIVSGDIDWANEADNIAQIIKNGLNLATNIPQDNEFETIASLDFETIGETLDILRNSELFSIIYDNTLDALNEISEFNQYVDFTKVKAISWESEMVSIEKCIDALNEVDAIEYISSTSFDIKIFINTYLLAVVDELNDKKLYEVIVDELINSKVLQSCYDKIYNKFVVNEVFESYGLVIPNLVASNLINFENESTTLNEFFLTVFDYVNLIPDEGTDFDIIDFINEVDISSFGESLQSLNESALFKPIISALIIFAEYKSIGTGFINYDFYEDVNFSFETDFNKLENILNFLIANDVFTGLPELEEDLTEELLARIALLDNFGIVIANNLLDMTLGQYCIVNLINYIDNQMPFEVETVNVNVTTIQSNLTALKSSMGSIMDNLLTILPDIIDGELNADLIVDNLDSFENILVNAEGDLLFNNLYDGLIEYLQTNEEINSVFDFSQITDNFDWATEFDVLENGINLLDNYGVIDALLGGDGFDTILDTLTIEQQANIYNALKDSVLLNKINVMVANMILEQLEDFTLNTYTLFDTSVGLLDQAENVKEINAIGIELGSSMSSIDLDNVDLILLGELMNALMDNKFDLNGNFSLVYDDLVAYLVDITKNTYANEVMSALRNYDNLSDFDEIDNVDWVNVLNIVGINAVISEVNELTGQSISYISALENISEIQEQNFNDIINFASEISDFDDINGIDLAKFGSFMAELLENKLSEQYTGLLAETYNVLVNYLVNLDDYGTALLEGINYYYVDETYIDDIQANWTLIASALSSLKTYTESIVDLSSISATELKLFINSVANDDNILVEVVAKGYLKNGITDAIILAGIDEFDFSNAENSGIIDELYVLKDFESTLSNVNLALQLYANSMNNLSLFNTSSVNTLIYVVSGISDNDFILELIDLDFANEYVIANSIYTILNSTMTLSNFESMVQNLIDSELLLEQIYDYGAV